MKKVKVVSVLLACSLFLATIVSSYTNVFADDSQLVVVESGDQVPLSEFLPDQNGQDFVDSQFPDTLYAPGEIVAQSLDSTSMMVSWGEVKGAEGYRVYHSFDVNGPYGMAATTPYTYVIDSDLESGRTYFYQIEAYSGPETGPRSESIQASTRIVSFDAPTNVSARGIDARTVVLKWDPVDSADGYYLYRCLTEFGRFTYLGTASGPTFTDVGLNPDTTYYYTVSAYDSGGTGERSLPVSAVTKLLPPDAPLNPSIMTGLENNQILLSWDSVSGAQGYNIYRATQPGEEPFLINTTGDTSFIYPAPPPDATYRYQIAAFNEGGVGSLSRTISITANATAPSMSIADTEASRSDDPSDSQVPIVSAQPLSTGGIRLTWTSVQGALSYTVYRSDSVEGSYSLIGSTSSLNLTDGGIRENTVYHYVVEANLGDQTLRSEPVNAKTQAARYPAPDFWLTNQGDGIACVWMTTPESTIANYKIYRSESPKGPYQPVADCRPATKSISGVLYWVDPDLSDQGTYYYKMSVVDESGIEGALSDSYCYWIMGQPADKQPGAGKQPPA